MNGNGFDAARVYRMWHLLIADEELYRAVTEGRTREMARSRELDETDVAILDEFGALPGTRWNIENLRFRAADEVATKLQIHLPRTMSLLTAGNEDWLHDLVYEYVAYHRWQEHGHFHFSECDRFVDYVHERIAKRRSLPPHLEVVMQFEQAINHLLRRTSELVPEDYPRHAAVDEAVLAQGRPRRSPAAAVVELADDIGEWIRSGDPRQGAVGPGPIFMLVYVPSPSEPYRLQRLAEGAHLVLSRCDGERTGAELVAALADDEALGFEPREVFGLLRRWSEDRAIAV